MKFAFIQAHAEQHRIVTMCRVLQVSKAGYYAWSNRPLSARAVEDAQLVEDIKDIHRRSRRTYGSPRVHEELKADGKAHGEKRIARIMHAEGIRAKQPRRFRVTTDSNHAHPVAPNVLARQFGVHDANGVRPVKRPLNQVWIGDITYLTTREGWLYLAVILDLASRRVIGWAMRHTLEGALTRDALQMALTTRQPASGVLHHTDRGSQYAAGDYQALLTAHGMKCSMSRVGDCWDNAVAESFFATLKRELADDADWTTREDARTAVFEYIEVWYNRQRRHSSLGYVSPVAYELEYEFKEAA
jgi:transposase InsO family protein